MPQTGIVVAAVSGFTITVLLGLFVIPILRKLKFGQTIRDDGPVWHKAKQGTPTMGGIIFAVGITVATLLGFAAMNITSPEAISSDDSLRMFSGLVMAVLFGAIGFCDDYIKVVKKRNLGLTAKQKIIMQIAVAAVYLTFIYFFCGKSTVVNIPFLGSFDLGFLYFPIMGILIIGIVNSVNLTDGVDGLCTTVTFIVAIFFMAASGYLAISGMNLLATALAGGCIGFLIFNLHPAKVFMGDTGSFFFGGVVMALGFCLHMEFILLIAGFVYCFESLSVILQVISCKTRKGKRIFKMSPIHHHFEMSGWKESKIVIVFGGVTILTCVAAFFAVIQLGVK